MNIEVLNEIKEHINKKKSLLKQYKRDIYEKKQTGGYEKASDYYNEVAFTAGEIHTLKELNTYINYLINRSKFEVIDEVSDVWNKV
jgi:hypothetical protein